jgi:hypothetical protein
LLLIDHERMPKREKSAAADTPYVRIPYSPCQWGLRMQDCEYSILANRQVRSLSDESFARDDIPQSEPCRQIVLGIRDEVIDIGDDEIDEAALGEGLPLPRVAGRYHLGVLQLLDRSSRQTLDNVTL